MLQLEHGHIMNNAREISHIYLAVTIRTTVTVLVAQNDVVGRGVDEVDVVVVLVVVGTDPDAPTVMVGALLYRSDPS